MTSKRTRIERARHGRMGRFERRSIWRGLLHLENADRLWAPSIVLAVAALGGIACAQTSPATDEELRCATANCSSDATCSDASGVPVCVCNAGYSGNGTVCAAEAKPDKGQVTTVEVGAAGAQVTGGAGDEVDIPAGALESDTLISVARDEPTLAAVPPTPNGGLVGVLVTFTPHGTRFATPVTMKIRVRAGATQVLRLADENDKTWEVVPNATIRDGFATFSSNTFSIYTGSSPTQKCDSGEFQSAAPTPISDRECTPLTQCAAGEFESAAPTPTSDRVCQKRTGCASGEFETGVSGDTGASVCQSFTECASGEFELAAPTTTSDRVCQTLTACTSEEYVFAPPTQTSDRQCSPHTVCEESEWVSVAATATSDRECSPLTVCTIAEYVTTLPSATSDRACGLLSVCGPTEYESEAATPVTDRTCSAITTCDYGYYESSGPTPTSDRTCAGFTTCAATEYETAGGTATSDRQCSPLTSCTAAEYETVSGTATSNRQCSPLTSCTAAEYESVPATSVTDRTCTVAWPDTVALSGFYYGLHLSATGMNNLGYAVGSGDLNGDGLDDVIATARDGTIGATYVLFGSTQPTTYVGYNEDIDLSTLDGSDGFAFIADSMGDSVATGDINGDGRDELVVGGKDVDSGNGLVSVIFGSADAFSPIFGTDEIRGGDGSLGFDITIARDSDPDYLGESVAVLDLNGDGFDDIVLASSHTGQGTGSDQGVVYVIYGKQAAFDPVVSLLELTGDDAGDSILDGTVGFMALGPAGDDGLTAVGKAGDVNGDGVEDLVIGQRTLDLASDTTGAAYVLFGSTTGFSDQLTTDPSAGATLELTALDGTNGFRILGAEKDKLGSVVGGGTDVNGDGVADVLVGTYSSRSAYVVFGKATGSAFDASVTMPPAEGAGVQLNTPANQNSIAGASDMNGDGVGEILIGYVGVSKYSEVCETCVIPTVQVVFGDETSFPASLTVDELASGEGSTLTTATRPISFEGFAATVSGGDVNGDGRGDVIFGDTLADGVFVVVAQRGPPKDF